MQLDVVHAPEGTTRLRTLDDFRLAIEGEVDRMALRVGGLLLEAKARHEKRFVKWVETELPFGIDTARRLMAIHEAYRDLDPQILAKLPRPWQALYALRKVAPAQLAAGISEGKISESTTIAQARAFAGPQHHDGSRHHRADVCAGALMDCDPADLHPMVKRALLVWLRGS